MCACSILAISSSPRIGGNTDTLLDEILRGARRPDIAVEKINLSSLRLTPCNQCDKCCEIAECVIQDDMKLIYPKLLRADWLLFASPIYFMAHCAQAKILIDRCQVFWTQQNVLHQSLFNDPPPTRRGIFIAVGATHGPKVFAGAKETMKWFFRTLNMDYYDNLLFDGIDARGAIRNHPTALRQAYELGQQIAET